MQKLKEYARACKASGYDGIGENDIDELLKEYEKWHIVKIADFGKTDIARCESKKQMTVRVAYAWFIWEKGYKGETTIGWI